MTHGVIKVAGDSYMQTLMNVFSCLNRNRQFSQLGDMSLIPALPNDPDCAREASKFSLISIKFSYLFEALVLHTNYAVDRGNGSLASEIGLLSCRVVKLYATKEQREETFENQLIEGKFDVCITSYESINICHVQLRKFRWSYIIVDEAHRLKNEASLFSQNLRRFKTNLKLLITGTPLQNNLHELWSLLNFLLPQLFADSKVFDEWTGKYPQKTETSAELVAEQEQRNIHLISSLRKILTPFILRRTKESVSQGLPPKKEIQVLIGLSTKQLEIYKNILLKRSPNGDSKYARNILMQAKSCV